MNVEDSSPQSLTQPDASLFEEHLKHLQELASQGNYRDFWASTLRIDEMFMTFKPLLKEEFDRLWSRYRKVCEVTEQEESVWRGRARGNATRIEQEIERLRHSHANPGAESSVTRYRYDGFWAHAKAIREMFDSLPLLEADLTTLWTSYSSLCVEVREVHQQAQEESRKHRQKIEFLIKGADSSAEASSSREEMGGARSTLRQALEVMKETRLLRGDRDHCWNYWREVNQKITSKQQDLQTASFTEAKQEADKYVGDAYQGDPYEALRWIKEIQKNVAGLYLSREQRDELHSTLNDAWQKAQARIGEIKEERQRQHEEWVQRQEERKRRHEDWRQRMTANLARWEGEIKEAEGEISQLEQGVSGLQEELAQATRAEYVQVLKRMIAEKQGEMSRLKERMSDWHRRVQEVRSQLDQAEG